MKKTELKEVRKWGNSAGILVPKEWIGKQVKVILVDRTQEIRKEVLSILEPYLHEIIGVYLVGSYARHEQESDSDIDIVAISKNISKNISSGKYNIEIYTIEGIMKTLRADPLMIYPRLKEAKAILNHSLLEDLLKIEITINSFKEYIEACKRIIKINREFIALGEAPHGKTMGHQTKSINLN